MKKPSNGIPSFNDTFKSFSSLRCEAGMLHAEAEQMNLDPEARERVMGLFGQLWEQIAEQERTSTAIICVVASNHTRDIESEVRIFASMHSTTETLMNDAKEAMKWAREQVQKNLTVPMH